MVKKKILLIDDDDTYMFIIKMLLMRQGFDGEIVTVGNGSEALELLKTDFEQDTAPQIIICDIEMPVMGGITFSRELARLELVNYACTKVVLNSNRLSYSDLDWAKESPTVTYFPKPLSKAQLVEIIADKKQSNI